MKFVIQWKIDGSSISLDYKKGKLINATTRGSGTEGELVTSNVKRMQNAPHILPIPFTGSLRGEIILLNSTFKEIFKPRGDKNPRNTAAGLVRNQKPEAAEFQKHLKIVYYDIITEEKFSTEIERINYIKTQLKLETVETISCNTADEAWEQYQKMEQRRPTLDFEVDGVVVRTNSVTLQEKLGTGSDLRPKWARAIKFTSLKAITTLEGILITQGHTGAMIPTGMLKPVEIGGVTVSNVLLNNYDYIEQLGLTEGCQVEIERAGDVIPRVIKLIKATSTPIVPPTECIVCKSVLVKDGVHWVCQNEGCEGKAFQRLKNWVTKREIKFLGDNLLETLYNKHHILVPADLYTLTEEFLSKVERGAGVVGTASKAIMAEINKSKNCSLSDFLGSLGIQFMGRRQAEIMAGNGVDTLEKFLNVTADQLRALPGFSEEGSKAPGIVAGIQKAKPQIERLLKFVTITVEEKVEPTTMDHPFSGKSFVFTGVRMKPDELAKFKAIGAIEKSGVSKGLDFLVAKDTTSGSSKMKKAESLGVKVLSLQEFQQQLG
jgi:DNA ligase (NAD+)